MSEPAFPVPQPIEARPEFTVGTVLSRSFSVWGQNVLTFFGVSLLLHAPLLLWPHAAAGKPPSTYAALLPLLRTLPQMLLGVIVNGTLIFAVFQQLRGQPVGLGRALSAGLRMIGPVVVVSLLAGLLVSLWGLLLIVPGIMAACRYWVAVPVVVVERRPAGEAIYRSKKLTDGYRWPIFGITILTTIFSTVLIMGVALVVPRTTAGFAVAEMIALALVGSFSAVVYAVGYYFLRAVKEGIDLEDLVKVFA